MRRLLAALAVALAISACRDPASPPEEASPPVSLAGLARGWNVVIVSIDTLRADRLGAWGYGERANSPSIDALVAEGVRFADANAPRALTWPSLATMLTGLYPSSHGVIDNGRGLADAQPALPLLLRAAGYRTAAFLSNMCRANHQGWDHFACAGGVDRRLNREALAWLASRREERERSAEGSASASATGGAPPFLLWVHYFGPHPPYYNGGDRALGLDPGYQGVLVPRKGVLDRVMTEPIDLGDADRRHLDALYDAAVIGTDALVRELLEGLTELGENDRTLVVFVADHGEDLYQHHGYLYHACSVYQSSLHVPLAVVAPGLLPAGATVTGPVELSDVLPTLLELLGLEAPPCVHGRSLLPALERAAEGQTFELGTQGTSAGLALSEYGDSRISTFTEGTWKLVSNPENESVPCMQGAPAGFYPIAETELYDLAVDPREQRDLSAAHPDVVARLRDLEDVRRASLCRVPARPLGQEALPDDVRRQLEELGYVVGDGDDAR
jgi:arylsulfatase A-like enzyme